jgi:hypothetical protein
MGNISGEMQNVMGSSLVVCNPALSIVSLSI